MTRVFALALACAATLLVGLVLVAATLLVHDSIAFLAAALVVTFGAALVRRRLRRAVLAAAGVAALVLTLASATIAETVASPEDQREVGYGYPFHFVRASMARYDPLTYPQTYEWNPWEDPATLDLPRFWLSYAAILAVVVVPAWLAVRRR